MFITSKYLVLIAILLRSGNAQSIVNETGSIGFPFIASLVSVAGLIFLLASLGNQTEDLDDACNALLEDSEVSEAKETALDDCKGCTGKSEDDCEDSRNCAYSDGTCFLRGDACVPALYCSLILRNPDQIANCQLCFGLPQEECIEDEPNLDCNFADDVGLCVPDTDDYTPDGPI